MNTRWQQRRRFTSHVTCHTGITIYECEPDEAVLFRQLACGFGVMPTITCDPVSDANIDLALGNRCVSVGHKTRLENSSLLALSQAGVRYISTRSIGFNHIDVPYAQALGIVVGNVAYSPDSVADYTLMLMLMALRHAKAVISRADQHDYRLNGTRGRELRDLTAGVIGTGRIGTAVIERLKGFGCATLAYDSHATSRAEQVPLDELLERSDLVTLHVPLDVDTHHLLDRRRIQQMKQDAVVINTGRGSLLDSGALVEALESGALGGAALDVVEGEEDIFYADCRDRDIDNHLLLRLQALPNVVITPHTAYYTDHALSDIVEASIANCVRFDRGERRG
jgi:D-specific alpha-keto acid dehydrogenase